MVRGISYRTSWLTEYDLSLRGMRQRSLRIQDVSHPLLHRSHFVIAENDYMSTISIEDDVTRVHAECMLI